MIGYVSRAINSVRSQSSPDFEIIVVDNYSTDDTMERIRKARDPRIVVEKFDNKGIIAAARNRGAGIARGEWIAFLDSDDYWDREKLSICGKYLDVSDVVYHDLRRFGRLTPVQRIRRRMRSYTPRGNILKSMAGSYNEIALSSLMMRKELFDSLKGFDENPALRGVEDFDLLLRAAARQARFRRVPIVLGHYRLHAGNFSLDQRRRQHAHIELYRKYAHEGFVAGDNRRMRAQRALLLARGSSHTRSAFRLAMYALWGGSKTIQQRAVIELIRIFLQRLAAAVRSLSA
jgi:glycosyltransferase involved in cell wall biosynthesis